MNQTLLQWICIFILISLSISKNKHEWKSRSVIQILTDRYARDSDEDTSKCDLLAIDYCKGTYKGILKHLDYIENMGFDAIWISPILENKDKSYHGYHFTNLYKLNENFGKEEDLRELIDECHRRGIWVMVDIVANHSGHVPIKTDSEGKEYEDFSVIYPFNKEEYYHEKCQIGQDDWDSNQYIVEMCRLANLPDLKQENVWVKNTLMKWIKELVRKYKFDGIRIDTIPEIPPWFWSEFSIAAGVFQIGEVFNSRTKFVANYQNYIDSVFNYPLYYSINNGFCKSSTPGSKDITGDLTEMHTYFTEKRKEFKDPTILGLFLENHDNARFLCNCNDPIKFKNALAVSFIYEGLPVFYYGAEQSFSGCNDPLDREPLWETKFNQKTELYKMIAALNKFRKEQRIWEKNLHELAYRKDLYVFSRGRNIFFVATNTGIENSIEFKINHPENTKFCNVLGTDDCVTVNSEKMLLIKMKGEPKIFLKQ